MGRPDLALLPIGAYEPRWFMGPVHMDPAQAVRAHQDLGAHQSVAIHFGTFQMADEGFDQPARELHAALVQAGIAAGEFVVPRPGERFHPTLSQGCR
jgi:L-ascorbate metabolism protein UlaG (beta-lactamase superfamily)